MVRRRSDLGVHPVDKGDSSVSATDYDHTPAHYDLSFNHMVIAQEQRESKDAPYIGAEDGAFHGVAHESGHGVDAMVNVTGHFHSSLLGDEGKEPESDYGRDFSAAYLKGITALEGNIIFEGRSLDYFLCTEDGGSQPTRMLGRAELFAEMFAETLYVGKGVLHRAFPECGMVLARIMRSVDHEFESQPDIGRIPVAEMSSASQMAVTSRVVPGRAPSMPV